MSSRITPQQYGQAVLEHVQSGAYPDSEDVISAELPPSALPDVTKLVEQAQEDVKATIRQNSKSSAPDIDGWISQAKQLRVDIQKSQEIARGIIEQAQQGEVLGGQVNDAASKVQLLNGEVAFNKSLGAVLERLQAIQGTLDLAQRATLDDHLLEAVNLLGQAEADLASLSVSRSTRVAGVLGAKITDLRGHVIEKLTKCWKQFVHVDSDRSSITINQHSNSELLLSHDFPIAKQVLGSPSVKMASLVDAMKRLNLFDEAMQQLCKDFESLITIPRFQVGANSTVRSLEVDGHSVATSGSSSDLSAHALFSDINLIIDFLRSQLPAPIVEPLAGLLMPRLVSRLISTWLASAVPEELDGLEDFEDTMSLVQHFAVRLDSCKWPGKRELRDWTQSIPDIWLRKRQEISLDRIRKLLSKGLGAVETVERVETQKLSRNDEVFAGNGGGDDWDAGWSDEEPSAEKHTIASPDAKVATGGEEEEDVSAWGLDDDREDSSAQTSGRDLETADDDAEAWGWGNENESEEPSKPKPPTKISSKKPKSNGILDLAPQAEREITLRETYNITSLPREILAIITQVVSDARSLETTDFADSPIAVAAPALLSLPGLVLAMYRAGASSSYSRHPSGPMFLYNDSLWLTERLQDQISHQITALGKHVQSRTAYNLKLDTHILALETFGKRTYAKEMESQRTIMIDLLDGAQGFSNCTEHPFNQECDIAVASTIDRLGDLNKEWKNVLSHSALLQSLGSLLSTVTNKIVVDIEDMSDISEPESQQLTSYCNRIAALEDLFLPTIDSSQAGQNDGQDPPIPLTALYVPHWLKFRYLANILESSLVDIKYLWTKGELALEFDTEELVDLILALFADSPHRRNAVAEIRGRRGVR